MMGAQLKAGNHSHLTITRNTHAKYYTLLLPDELAERMLTCKTHPADIVASCTLGEFRQFIAFVQTSLELSDIPGD